MTLFEQPNIILVETKNGIVEVDEDHSMWSTKYVQKYVTEAKDLFYTAKGGMHKEVRRGCFPRAWAFARIMEKYKTNSSKQYLRKIWAEETRNLDLLARFYDGTDLRDLVRLFCQSKKTWELSWDDLGIFSPTWFEVAHRYNWNPNLDEGSMEDAFPFPFPLIDDFEDWFEDKMQNDKQHLLESVVAITSFYDRWKPMAKKIRPLLVAECMKIVPEELHPALARLNAQYHLESLSFLVQLIAEPDQIKLDECNSYNELLDTTKIDLPIVENYIFDNHHWVGRARIKKIDKEDLFWNKPMPGKIDFRWSGNTSGTLWRHLAGKQFGTAHVAWEDVVVEGNLLKWWTSTVGHKL